MHILTKLLLSGWVLLFVYLLVSAVSSSKDKIPTRRKSNFLRAAILILFLLIIISIPAKDSNYLVINNSAVRVIGFVLFLLGLTTIVWARANLGKNWGFPMSQKANPELITSGPYQFVRHPIYAGILLSLLGTTLCINTYWLFLLIMSGAFFIYSALMEEKMMSQAFPKEYADYKKKTKMIIPFLL
jgi:protein-S-isoprenylcysteine O-methyltransferase Ste14